MIALPTLTAARAAIAPYTLAIKVGLAVALLVAVLAFAWRASVWRDGWQQRDVAKAAQATAEAALRDERDCLKGTACARRIADLARDGAEAVRKATEDAQEAARAEQARVAAEGQAAVERATAAASVARVRLLEAEARLRKSLAEDATCAEQAAEVIRCNY